MTNRDLAIKYLNISLDSYISAKEFADFKVNRLINQNEMFANPRFLTELSEYQSQLERCRASIEETLQVIDWLNQLETTDTNK